MIHELLHVAKEVTKLSVKVAVVIPCHLIKGDLVSEKGFRHDLKEGFFDGVTSDKH